MELPHLKPDREFAALGMAQLRHQLYSQEILRGRGLIRLETKS